MTLRYETVLVFGPTGRVGSSIALEAAKRGAKVWLAMRDPTKTIPGLVNEQELQGSFKRVKADLTDSSSVKQAVEESGARAAFIYASFAPGGMIDTLKAMKDAGVEYIVLLSSFSVRPDQDRRKIAPQDLIAFVHGQIELGIEDLGFKTTILRPAQFASNIFRDLNTKTDPWEGYVLYEEYKGDGISPGDIGRVGGTMLVNPPSTSQVKVVYLCGPKLLTALQQFETLQKVSGKDVKIVQYTEDQYKQHLTKQRIPPPVADYLVEVMKKAVMDGDVWYTDAIYTEGVANIKKYSGYEPTTFEQFLGAQNL